MIPDYSVTVTVKNNYLLTAMREAGYETSAALSRATGVHQITISKFLNLKLTPYSSKGVRKGIAKISEHLKKLPEDLFPPKHIEDPLKTNKQTITLYQDQIKSIAGSQDYPQMIEFKESADSIKQTIAKLRQREQLVINKRFGLNGERECTLEEMAKELNVTRERIRQIEKRALLRLRNGKGNLLEARETIMGVGVDG
ncbi:MAG: sigma-70 family RNA polymerase sigma factor [Planctomycetota bacterium]|jgi:RNA polymerase sigma factor (sigma-70 family)